MMTDVEQAGRGGFDERGGSEFPGQGGHGGFDERGGLEFPEQADHAEQAEFGLTDLLHPGQLRDPAQRARLWKRVGELLRFGAVGGVAFVVNFGVFNLARALGLSPLWANVVAVVVATLVSWLGNRFWTFSERKTQAPRREVIGFFVVNIVGLLIENAMLGITHYGLGFTALWMDNLSKFVGTGIGTIFRYVAYRRWVFTGS
ncbi:MAG: GtrA family protein [Cellulomonadaceae bacterium]|jgi:putative flippase GtrA|nr:GtrA family protein [Cellulomonadaceae bacterium]